MRILVTGSRGMVGTAVCQTLKDHDLITPTKAQLNTTRLSQVMSIDCDFIIHLAAETDHEYCDENPSQCYLVNTIGTANLTRLARKLNIPILYLSAASVFDGSKNEPYNRHDIPNPINHYNASKYYGELIAKSWVKHFILRPGWMFGGGPNVDKKFVNKIMSKVNRGDKVISVCDDCIGSPTYTNDLAECIKKIVDGKYEYGIYGTANHSSAGVSRYDFACGIKDILNLNIQIVRCKIDDLKEEFPCKRTNYEVIFSNIPMRSWEEALKEYLYAEYKH